MYKKLKRERPLGGRFLLKNHNHWRLWFFFFSKTESELTRKRPLLPKPEAEAFNFTELGRRQLRSRQFLHQALLQSFRTSELAMV